MCESGFMFNLSLLCLHARLRQAQQTNDCHAPAVPTMPVMQKSLGHRHLRVERGWAAKVEISNVRKTGIRLVEYALFSVGSLWLFTLQWFRS